MKKVVLAFGLMMSGLCVQAQDLYPKLRFEGFQPEFSKSMRNGLFHDSTTITLQKGQYLFLRPMALRKSTVKIEIETAGKQIDAVQELKKFNDTFIYESKNEGKYTIHFSSDNKKTVCEMHLVPFAPKLPDGFDKLSLSEKLISIGRMAEIDFIPLRKTQLVGIYNPGNSEILASDVNPLNGVTANVTIDSKTAFTCAVYKLISNSTDGSIISKIRGEIDRDLIAAIKKEEGVKTVYTGLAGSLQNSSDLYAPYDSQPTYFYNKTSDFGHYLIEVKTEGTKIYISISKIDTIPEVTLEKK